MALFGGNQPSSPPPAPRPSIGVPDPVPGATFEEAPARELQLLVRAGYRIVFVETGEVERAEQIVAQVAHEASLPLATWTHVNGIRPWGDRGLDEETVDPVAALASVLATETPIVCMFEHLSTHLEDPRVLSLLRQLADGDRATVVLLETAVVVPQNLRRLSATFTLARPSAERVRTYVDMRIEQLRAEGTAARLDEEGRGQLAASLRGLTLEEIDRVVTRLVVEDGVLDVHDLPSARDLRAKAIAGSGIVQLTGVTQGLDWVAGLDNLKAWAATRRPVLDQRAIDFGLQPAKGLLLTGVPGCGKSMAIKALAATWQLPLLRLDAGSLMAKFVGESEHNLRSAFDVCSALSPSILWIDELEKAFSSQGASEADGGLGFRLLGMLLTWMQERDAPVFLAATANNIDALPPELTRQGRFDQIFFVDLPEHAERAHLFALQLAQRRRDYQAFDCDALAAASDGFSGAEIEQCVVSALYDAYAGGVDIDTAAILAQLARSLPLSRSAPERIERIREWGRERAAPA